MNNIGKYILGFLALVGIGIFCWYFSSIIAYVLIAAVVSFVGKPIIDLLGRIKIKGKQLPNSVKAAITLVVLWAIFVLFVMTIIPLVVNEFQNLRNVSVDNVVNNMEEPLNRVGQLLKNYGIIEHAEDIVEDISDNITSIVSISRIKSVFGSLAGTLSGLFVALFSISFISFFFLKDSHLFTNMVLAITPTRYDRSVKNALDSIQKLLVRYFVGIMIEVVGIMVLNSFGIWLIGFSFGNALVIGLVSGILNVIPYIGPIIGIVFGVAVGIVLNIEMPFYTDMLPLLIYLVIVMLITQLIDNIIFQPFIYGNSVYAHPLEIFLVILMAGSLAGIPGMIFAIPGYTVIRVILREFFSKYKLVKKITQSLDEQIT